MRLVSDRAVLSRAQPEALERLARFIGIRLVKRPCRCRRCQHALVEQLARDLPKTHNPR
jgi:hypothetical protein